MILSTLVSGAHYLTDVLGGFAVAGIAIGVAVRLVPSPG